jgi:hypothetical protein
MKAKENLLCATKATVSINIPSVKEVCYCLRRDAFKIYLKYAL